MHGINTKQIKKLPSLLVCEPLSYPKIDSNAWYIIYHIRGITLKFCFVLCAMIQINPQVSPMRYFVFNSMGSNGLWAVVAQD